MHYRYVGAEQGLSQNTLLDMLQDSQGFVWLATEHGLNRYDGYVLKKYHRKQGDPTSLPGDFVYSIAEDADKNLWFATARAGIARWHRDQDVFESFVHDPNNPASLGSNNTRKILITRDGHVWVGTKGAGISVLDPEQGTFRHMRHDPKDPDSLADNNVYDLLEDPGGVVWIGTGGGLDRFDRKRPGIRHHRAKIDEPGTLSHNEVRSLTMDRFGVLWLGTLGGGVNTYERNSGTFTQYRHGDAQHTLSHDNVRKVFEDSTGRIWIGTENGLNIFSRERQAFTRYHSTGKRGDLQDNDVMSIIQDRGGLIWYGTRNAGAHLWNPRSWLLGHTQPAWQQGAGITSFATDRTHTWVGTFGKGLFQINRGTGEVRTLNDEVGLNDASVMSLLLDRDSALWIGTMHGGLTRLDTQTRNIRRYRHDPQDPHSLPSNGVMSLLEDTRGGIWIGTYGGGVTLLAADRKTFTHTDKTTNPDFLGTQAMALAEDLHGAIWIGTEAGINLRQPDTGELAGFTYDRNDNRSLPAEAVYTLHVDHAGVVWAGTAGGGLAKVHGSSRDPDAIWFETQAALQRVDFSLIYGIQTDHRNELWLTGNNGLARYNPKQETVKVFSEIHGAQGNEFNFGAHHSGMDDRLYFGGVNGYNAFLPETLNITTKPPRVILTGFDKLNEPARTEKPYPLLDHIDVAYHEDVLTFQYSALDFANPSSNRYTYLLEGFDSKWIDAGAIRRATYTNLDAGRYTFRVRAANSEGVWSRKDLAITLRVAPAPWQTAWAYCAYVLLSLCLVAMMIQNQRRRTARKARYLEQLELEVANQTRELKVSNDDLQRATEAKAEFLARMSHEIRTPMNGVFGMSELLLATHLDQRQSRFVNTIHNSARSLLTIINDILDFSKIEAQKLALNPESFDVVALVDDAITLLATQAEQKGIELLCDMPFTSLWVKGDSLRIRQILTNLLGNAIKFTNSGEVMCRVSAKAHDRQYELLLSVEDTGIGIPEENLEPIFEHFAQGDSSTSRRFGGTGLGLAITKQLVDLMNGNIRVNSVPDVGSTFAVTLVLPKSLEIRDELSSPLVEPATGLNVLNAIDHGKTRRLLSSYLDLLGAHHTSVGTAAQLLAELNEAKDSYSIVIVDSHLKDMNSGALIDELTTRHPQIGIVNLTYLGEASKSGHIVLTRPVFVHKLVRTLSDTSTKHARNQTQSEVKPAPTRVLRLLVVEDSPVNQEVILGMLEGMDITPDVEDNGLAALSRLQNRRYDAVLMDCSLPGLDGLAVTRRIRESDCASRHTPIIALTANNISGERERCLNAGMNDFLAKPCTMNELNQTLRRWLAIEPIMPISQDQPEPVGTGLVDIRALNTIRQLQGENNQDLLSRVIALFAKDTRSLLDDLGIQIRASNAEGIRRIAHRLKSSSANLGASEFSDTCRRIEESAKAAGPDQLQTLLETLKDQLPTILSELDDHALRHTA